MSERFHRVAGYPDEVDAAGALARLLDGLGFRFCWATEGLDETDYAFAPREDCNSLGWMVQHIWGLTNWVHRHAVGGQLSRPLSTLEQREHVLEMLWMLRNHFAALTRDDLLAIRVEGYPFWHMINGPIADALTHVGQIQYVRGLLGKKGPPANVFTCEPPSAPAESM